MAEVNGANVQGIILRGYGKFDISCFVLLKVVAAAQTRKWLESVAPTVNTALRGGDYDRSEKPRPVMNLAFTFDGLVALGLHEANMRGFSKEFREGMCTAHRQRLLGDLDQSDPTHWRWGGPNNESLHLMLCLYATDQASMESFYGSVSRGFPLGGLEVIERLDGLTLEGRREHFGFRDGIAQPDVTGYEDETRNPSRANRVSAGEFLLGYQNEYGVFPDSPVVIQRQGTPEVLRTTESDGADLGRDGSYFVFRQLSQDVKAFWEFLDAKTRNSDGSGNGLARTALASKMVGRWPSGAPLSRHPNADPGGLSNEDDFGYRQTDPHGYQCPIGSHVRRTNPRDGLQDTSAARSTKITNHHRIIRRGRAYGPMFSRSMGSDDLLAASAPTTEVGLYFMCFNASIANQFEFVQANWVASEKFENLYNDPDPLIGARSQAPMGPPNFTIQSSPVRKAVTSLPRFVEVRGGAFLFMPSISALRFLASIGAEL